jgi:hypothetical protein
MSSASAVEIMIEAGILRFTRVAECVGAAAVETPAKLLT